MFGKGFAVTWCGFGLSELVQMELLIGGSGGKCNSLSDDAADSPSEERRSHEIPLSPQLGDHC